MPKSKLTALFVDKLEYDENLGRVIYWDSELSGFGIRIGERTKTFICQKRISGKKTKITIGKYPEISVADARRMASETFLEIAKGMDVNIQKKKAHVKGVTLREVFEGYKTSRQLRDGTLIQYNVTINKRYSDWLDMPIREITKDMVEERHIKFSKEYSGVTANKYARILRAVLNYAIARYEIDGTPIISVNPVSRISATKLWFRSKRKKTHLKVDQMRLVLSEVENAVNPVVADYIRFVMFTGCRRREISSLRWECINVSNRSFFVSDISAKNHEQLELPLTDYLMNVVFRMSAVRVNDFVFPSDRSVSGHIEEPKRTIIDIGKKIGYHFTIHDLRRTYITIAESLDISAYALKALVNHKLSASDVTSGYICMNVERLRKPMQMITDYILGRDNSQEN